MLCHHTTSGTEGLSIEIETYEWLRLLCVEDEDDARMLYEETLRFAFPSVRVAANGEAGLDIFNEWHPHIVLTDIRMPVMDGLELATRIKEQNPHTIIIIASAHSESDYLFQAIDAGVDAFINKPVKIGTLMKKIKKYAHTLYQEEQYLSTRQLLSEYKEAVDESLLVSKTTPDGKIIYANDAFIKISGYTKEELIGKNHRIVRHPDMPTEVFKQMWQTITQGKTWKGVVKNRTKDGGYYIVNVIIKPIMSRTGEILEYISMRQDITEQEEYREFLKKQLGMIQNEEIKEKLAMLSQYENAIEISTAFCRSNLNGEIIYANGLFQEITGYLPEELLNKTRKELLDANTRPCLLGGSNRSCSGQVKLFAKDGSTKHLNTTVVPIYDSSQNIREYMSINHDVTEVVKLQEEIAGTQREFLYRLGELAEMRSKETGQHVRRVAYFSMALAQAAGLSEEEVDLIKQASPMHDVGKIAIPDEILNKPARLTPEEFEVMKQHATIGYETFKASEKKILQEAALIAYTHHEKWDGSGYPRGLSGEDIPIQGRIVAIADVYDALGCDRVYKKAWEDEKIIEFFKEQSGRHFDPRLIELFLQILPEILEIKNQYAD